MNESLNECSRHPAATSSFDSIHPLVVPALFRARNKTNPTASSSSSSFSFFFARAKQNWPTDGARRRLPRARIRSVPSKRPTPACARPRLGLDPKVAVPELFTRTDTHTRHTHTSRFMTRQRGSTSTTSTTQKGRSTDAPKTSERRRVRVLTNNPNRRRCRPRAYR